MSLRRSRDRGAGVVDARVEPAPRLHAVAHLGETQLRQLRREPAYEPLDGSAPRAWDLPRLPPPTQRPLAIDEPVIRSSAPVDSFMPDPSVLHIHGGIRGGRPGRSSAPSAELPRTGRRRPPRAGSVRRGSTRPRSPDREHRARSRRGEGGSSSIEKPGTVGMKPESAMRPAGRRRPAPSPTA